MRRCGAYATQSTEISKFLAPCSLAERLIWRLTSFTSMIEPRIFEQAENATIRVRWDISGRRSWVLCVMENGLSRDVGVACQYFISMPWRAASFFQRPLFAALGKCRICSQTDYLPSCSPAITTISSSEPISPCASIRFINPSMFPVELPPNTISSRLAAFKSFIAASFPS